MMNKTRVSVIVPIYNAEKWLSACIESIRAQTLKEIEIICVDDGSTDDSLSVLEAFRKKDDRISIITQKNLGAGAARNRGLGIAQGEYLSFLDADDLFEPDMLEKTYNCSKKAEADICIFRFDKFDEQSGCFGDDGFLQRLLPDKQCFNISDVREDCFAMTNPSIWNKLFRREFVQENGILCQELPSVNDMFFTYKSLIEASRIVVFPEILAHYRVGEADALSNNRDKNRSCVYTALSALRSEMAEKETPSEKDFFNMVARQILYLLENIHDRTVFHGCIDEIKNSWVKELIPGGYGSVSFYNEKFRDRFHAMMAMDTEEYIYYEKKRTEETLDEVKKDYAVYFRQQNTATKKGLSFQDSFDLIFYPGRERCALGRRINKIFVFGIGLVVRKIFKI